jgi:hypothetical protein
MDSTFHLLFHLLFPILPGITFPLLRVLQAKFAERENKKPFLGWGERVK